MSAVSELRVLFFDVFGTCVAQRTPVADTLWKAAREALEADPSSMSSEVRAKAEQMNWNSDIDLFTKSLISSTGTVDWHLVDAYRPKSLTKLLLSLGLLLPAPSPPSLSLFTPEAILTLSKIWHRLPPWPDTIPGLDLLNAPFKTCTLSNTYNSLMRDLVSHGRIPFQEIFTSDLFGSYKPDPKVYLGAAERLEAKPEECGLVAAHLGDLKGAKKCGFYAIYVERELEEKEPGLKGEGIPDLVIKLGEGGGFVGLAERLGVK